MKKLVLLFSLLSAVSLCAHPCDSWNYADQHGRGVIRVRSIDGKLDSHRFGQTVNALETREVGRTRGQAASQTRQPLQSDTVHG